MKLKLYTAPATEPVTAAECKSHMHIDASDDDTYIGTLITAARQAVEEYTRRALITQTWELALDEAPCGDVIELPRPPLATVTHVKWYDDSDTETTISSSTYYVDLYAEPGKVKLRIGDVWPDQGDLRTANGILVRYTAGYGAASDVPQAIRAGVKETVRAYYDGDTAVGVVPESAKVYLKQFRVGRL